MAIGVLDSANLNGGQKLAVKYFTVAVALFVAQILFGILAGLQYLMPEFLYNVLDFNVNRMVHINAMIVWMLFGFIGAVYWLIEDEAGIEVVGLKLGNFAFWLFTSAVAVVVVVYLFIQTGPGTDTTRWLINEGREYIEAPRWADIGIVVCILIFFYNAAATFMKGRWSGISGVLVLDLVALAGLAAGMMFVLRDGATASGENAADSTASISDRQTGPSGLPVPRFVSLKTDRVNVRRGPSTEHQVIWVYARKGLPVEIIAEHERWGRVRDSDGEEGWVYHSLLAGRRTGLIAPWRKGEKISLKDSPQEASTTVALSGQVRMSSTWAPSSSTDPPAM